MSDRASTARTFNDWWVRRWDENRPSPPLPGVTPRSAGIPCFYRLSAAIESWVNFYGASTDSGTHTDPLRYLRVWVPTGAPATRSPSTLAAQTSSATTFWCRSRDRSSEANRESTVARYGIAHVHSDPSRPPTSHFPVTVCSYH